MEVDQAAKNVSMQCLLHGRRFAAPHGHPVPERKLQFALQEQP